MNNKEIECRHCGKALKRTTSGACNPDTGEEARQNHYGGWVCSRRCDYNECLDMTSSVPGAGGATRPSVYAQKQIDNNWGWE